MIYVVFFFVALLSGLLTTRLAKSLAIRFDFVDKPDGRRKMQQTAIPMAGGVGVYLAATFCMFCLYVFLPEIRQVFHEKARFLLSLMFASTIILLVGLLDDKYNLRARYKLLGQVLAALIMIGPGQLLIEAISFMDFRVELGLLQYPFTLFWFIAAINAINLLDGMDGMLGTIGVVILGALAAMAIFIGAPIAGWIALIFAGSLCGFLRYNLPPASVYLGDGGSMLIGLIVASLPIESCLKGPAIAIIGPAVLLILPIIDTSAAIIRRKLTGRGIAIPDRGHFHHVLMRGGFSTRRILILVAVLSSIAAAGTLLSVFQKNDLLAIGSAAAIILILVLGGLFGNAEYRLIRERTKSLFRKARHGQSHIETEVRLHGDGEWDCVWKEVTSAAEQLNLQTICLDVNAPAWHEDYHVRWDRVGSPPSPYMIWRAELPLFGHGHAIGRLTVAGPIDEKNISEKLKILSEIVAHAESRVLDVAASGRHSKPDNVAMNDNHNTSAASHANTPKPKTEILKKLDEENKQSTKNDSFYATQV